MRVLSFILAATILSAQSPTGNVELTNTRLASVKKLRQQLSAITDRFEPHTFTGRDGDKMPYRLFRPRAIPAGRAYPLVIFLHGSGGIGTDNVGQITGGNLIGSRVWALDANQVRQPVFVIAPQSGQAWVQSVSGQPQPSERAPGANLLFELLDSVLPALPIDRRRIYLTGQSLGG